MFQTILARELLYSEVIPRLIDGESTSVDEMYLWGKKNDVEIETYYMHKVWKRKKPEYNDGYSHSYRIFNRE